MVIAIAALMRSLKKEASAVAESGGPKKRLKEIKAEMAAAKQKLAALKVERNQLRVKLTAQKAAKPEKPA